MILFLVLVAAIPFVLPIVSFVLSLRLRERVRSMEQLLDRQQRSLDELTRRLTQLRKDLTDTAAAAPAPAAAPRAPAVTPPPVVAPPTPTAVTPPPLVVPAPPPATPPPVIAQPQRPAGRPAPPPPRAPVRAPSGAAPIPRPALERFDWETLIGVKMFSAVAGIALVLAAVFFLRYSMDHGWLAPPIRVAIGIISGVALLALCELKAARQYSVTANALDAAGIAILFSTFFAAHALWHLIPASVAFGLLILVTTVAVLLSLRRDSLFIAVLGLLGGFATPVLLSAGENRPVPLFAYLLLLNVGLALVAYRKAWPVLTILTLLFTTFYQWAWVIRFLSASQLSLAMSIFLVFAVSGFVGLVSGARAARGREEAPTLERLGVAAAAMPVVFAAYLATVPAYGAHAGLLFGFLLIVDAGLLAASIARRDEYPHAIGSLATVLVTAVWFALSYSTGSWIAPLTFVAAFVLFFLTAPMVAQRLRRPLSGLAARAVYAASVLLFAFAVIAALEPATEHPWLLFGVMFPLLALIAWRALATGEFALYFIAAFFGVAAEAAWSAAHLTADHLRAAVVLYAAFALFYFGVPFAARRSNRPIEPRWGSGAVLIVSLLPLMFRAAAPRPAAALWGLALLLAILNAGIFIESAAGRLPAVSVIGGVLSWIVLAVWWGSAAAAVGVLPSLLVLVGLSLTMLAGHAWAHAQTSNTRERDSRFGFKQGTYLGLLGHVFLFFIALDPRWALPPWPLFGAIAVLTLAVTATSLYIHLPELHIAGVAAASIIVCGWSRMAEGTLGWAGVGAAEVVCAYALIWVADARRNTRPAAIAAAIALFVAEFTLTAAARGASTVPIGVLAAAHATNIAIVLALSWMYRWNWIAPAAVVPAWIATAAWLEAHSSQNAWSSAFALAAALYAVFAAYPFVLGARARDTRDPAITAVAGSAFFFFTARNALLHGGFERFVGIVPVVEGAVLALLLRQLLRYEKPGSRDQGRLALVAAASLAFATVAIPVQLRHQWITIGWALEAAALAWAYGRIRHRGLLYWSVALFAVVFVRLALNPAVLVYEPRGARVLNWHLYTFLISGAALIVAGWLFSKTDDALPQPLPPASALLPTAGVIVLFLLLNIEIADFYATGPAITFRFGVTLAQDLTYTIGWLMFGLALLTAGIYVHAKPARIAAIVLIAVTACKAFLYDMGSLGGLYRVVSLVGLGVSLSLVALALQKFVLQPSREQA